MTRGCISRISRCTATQCLAGDSPGRSHEVIEIVSIIKHLGGKRRRSRRVGSGSKWYQRERNPVWVEAICSEQNDHLKLGGEDYMVSADGFIMPAKKGQAPRSEILQPATGYGSKQLTA
jgi:hypothetical protein